MKRIRQIILAFMLGMLPIQAVWADRNADLLGDLAQSEGAICERCERVVNG